MQAVFEARLFDGESARAQRVEAHLDPAWLHFGTHAIPVKELRRDTGKHGTTLHWTEKPDWRMIVSPDQKIDFHLIQKLHAVTARHWQWIGGSVVTVAAVSAIIWFFGGALLTSMAPLVPQKVADGIGEQYADFFAPEGKQCKGKQGNAALAEIMARIQPKTSPYDTARVTVVDSDTINAITLPGGRILLFRGLIDQAESADEVAGVLAHELGHVGHYHGNQALLRHFGLGVFLEGVGGNIGSAASTGLFLSNSRTAEREADGEAINLLRNGQVSAMGVSDFFARLGGGEPGKDGKGEKGAAVDSDDGFMDVIATHPGDADRRKRFAEAAKTYKATPTISDDDWKALKAICKS